MPGPPKDTPKPSRQCTLLAGRFALARLLLGDLRLGNGRSLRLCRSDLLGEMRNVGLLGVTLRLLDGKIGVLVAVDLVPPRGLRLHRVLVVAETDHIRELNLARHA